MNNKNYLPTALLTVLTFALAPVLTAASFGPGRAQMIPAGGGEVLLDEPAKQVALRFVAEHDGPLTEIRFASRVGQIWTEQAPKLFTVTLVEDNAGKPGRPVTTAEVSATFPGARARVAFFRDAMVKAGRAYHLVIAMPGASATKQISVNYYLFDARGQPLNSYDMDTLAPGGGVLISTNGGSAWAPAAPGAIGAMSLTIGGHIQGWAYTGSYDARFWNAPGGTRQVLMQTFKFTTGGKGASAKIAGITFQLRAQGGLANLAIPVRVRIFEGIRSNLVVTATLPVTTEDVSRFFQVEVPLSDVVLKEGGDYMLAIDIPEPAGASMQDYLFIRTLSWGFGDPSLVDATWQGAEGAMIQSPSDDPAAGVVVTKVDIPFFMDYTPVR